MIEKVQRSQVQRVAIILLTIIVVASHPVAASSVTAYGEDASLTVDVRQGSEQATEVNALLIYQDRDWSEPYRKVENYPTVDLEHVFSNLPGGHEYLVTAYIQDQQAGTTGWIELSDGEAAETEITAEYREQLNVRAFHDDGLTPLEDARMTITSQQPHQWRSGTTGSDGYARTDDGSRDFYLYPPDGASSYYTVEIYHDGSEVASRQVNSLDSSRTIELTTSVPVTHSLSVSSTSGGDVDAEDTGPIEVGREIDLEADPDSGYIFDEWDGDVPAGDREDDDITVSMDEDKDLKAEFVELGEAFFEVSKASTVDGYEPTGDPVEDARIEIDGEVVYTDSNGNGQFDLAPGQHSYTVSADGYETVTGDFNVNEGTRAIVPVSLPRSGVGGLTVNVVDHDGNAVAANKYRVLADGDQLQLDAQGDVLLDEGTYEITVEPTDFGSDELKRVSKTVTVTAGDGTSVTLTPFATPTYTLDVDVPDSGGGVSIDPPGVSAQSDVSQTYEEGTEVTVTAEPAQGYEFDHWEGDHPSENSDKKSINVTLSDHRSLFPVFTSIDDNSRDKSVSIVEYDLQENNVVRRINYQTRSDSAAADSGKLPVDSSAIEYPTPEGDPENGPAKSKHVVSDTTRYPNSAIVQIESFYDNSLGVCSGAIIEDNHVLTAAHCVYDSDLGWPESVYVTPGLNNISRTTSARKNTVDSVDSPFNVQSVSRIQTYERYTSSGNNNFDLAVLTLREDVGEYTGTFGYDSFSDTSKYQQYVHASGYPASPPNDEPYGTQWDTYQQADGLGTFDVSCPAWAAQARYCHDLGVDLSDGFSGGPVWQSSSPAYGNDLPNVMSVISQSKYVISDIALRITPGKYSDIGRMIDRGNSLDLATNKPQYEDAGSDYYTINTETVEIEDTTLKAGIGVVNKGTDPGSEHIVVYRLNKTDSSISSSIGSSTVSSITPFTEMKRAGISTTVSGLPAGKYDLKATIRRNGEEVESANLGEVELLPDPGQNPESIYANSFESTASGSTPDNWVAHGNSAIGVTDSVAADGSKSLRLSGSSGGCWETVAFSDIGQDTIPDSTNAPDTDAVNISFDVRPMGNADPGCHDLRNARFRLDTGNGAVYGSSDQNLMEFRSDSNVVGTAGQNQELGSYAVGKWTDVTIQYERSQNQNITVTYYVDGERRGQVVKDEPSFANDFRYLEVATGEYTTYVDNINITTSEGAPPTGTQTGAPTVSADGDTTEPGEEATVEATIEKGQTTAVSNIPAGWSVVDYEVSGGTFSNQIDNEGIIMWTWPSGDQDPKIVSVTFEVSSDATNTTVDVVAEDSDGNTAETDATVTVESSDSTGSISGQVIDEQNRAVPNASVIIEDDSGSTVEDTTTNRAGEYSVELSPGEYTVIAKANGQTGQSTATVTNDETTLANIVLSPSSTESATLELEPQEITTSAGQTATYSVMLENAGSGVGSYEYTVTSSDSSVAAIKTIYPTGTDYSDALTSVDVAPSGETASIKAGDVSISETGDVQIGTLEVNASDTGTANLSLSKTAVGDTESQGYTLESISGGTLSVTTTEPAVIGDSPVQDMDDDGEYEDINGDGEFDIVDVNAFFQNHQSPAVKNNPDLFDYNDDGEVNIIDVNQLFQNA